MSKPPIRVFISYAHDDDRIFNVFAQRLKTHLKSRKEFEYVIWDDDKIPVGSPYNEEIQAQLASCDLAILCISANFLASDFIKTKEFGVLIKDFPSTILAPFLFSPCEYKSWGDLAVRQLFKPSGDDYDEATTEDFTFAELVRFNKKDGGLVQNVNIDKYIKNFISKFEEVLPTMQKKSLLKPKETTAKSTIYINNYPYFEKDKFFGRDELLKQIDDKLKALDIPLLLSGIGGMGKTAVAIAYGEEYSSGYDHIAWIDVTESIFNNLFKTFQANPAIPFEYSPDGDRKKDIANVLGLLKSIAGNNLLIIDNANEEKDLQEFINAWKRYQPDWKCLITTRSGNNTYKDHLLALQVVSLDAAEKIYRKHNNKNFDKDSFEKIYNYIGGHTFLIELLAKFGQENNTINSSVELLDYLKSKSITALNRSVIAKKGQGEDTDKMVSEFVLELYDPMTLSEKEQEYMRYFSVMPVSEIKFDMLTLLFFIEEENIDEFDVQITQLAKKGWLIQNQDSFKCHQIIQEICREKLHPTVDNCFDLMGMLGYLFQKTAITTASLFFECGFSFVNYVREDSIYYALFLLDFADKVEESGNLSDPLNLLKAANDIFHDQKDYNESVTLQRIGSIYDTQGNDQEALKYHLEYYDLAKKFSESDPNNSEYAYSISIACEKLGSCYYFIDNIDEALKYFLEGNSIVKKLIEKGNNTEFKKGLAISHQNLGDLYQSQDDTEKALDHFRQYNEIAKQLSITNPNNDDYTHGYAISFLRLGRLYQKQDDHDKAFHCFSEYNKIENELVEKHPESIEYNNNLAYSLLSLGDISLGEEKKEFYLSAKRIWEELLLKAPEFVYIKINLEAVNDELKGL